MKTLEESIAIAMDGGRNSSIVPFLPYILQDLWEIGTPPGVVIDLIRKHCNDYAHLHVLDLGCGKGAVCVKLAEALQCNCYGIDGIPEFIETSKLKAKEYGVDALCYFETDDIRERINDVDKFDVIILGAIGQVFGDYHDTLIILSAHLKEQGIIIINDAYIEDASTYQHPGVLPHREVMRQIGQAGMEMIDESTEATDAYADEFENLHKRCRELIAKYPDKASLFEDFIHTQAGEYLALENDIVGSIMVVKKKSVETIKAHIISLEKQALKLWNNGNPDGFINLSSDDVVYIDPAFTYKLEGKQALEEYYGPLRGKIKIDNYKIINPTVQLSSDMAVLTYDYEAYRDNQLFKMHCTEVYRSVAAGDWQIIHTHWSFVMPENE